MTRPVTPAGRRRDRIALALLLAGVILAAVPSLRLAEMAAGRGMVTTPDRTPRNQERVRRLVFFATMGGVIVLAGVAASVWSFARHAKDLDLLPDALPDAQADHS